LHRLTRLCGRSCALVLVLWAVAGSSAVSVRPGTPAARVLDHGRLPLAFEANHGQADGHAQFLARGPGYRVGLAPTGIVVVVGAARPSADHPSRPVRSVITMTFVGASEAARGFALEPLPGRVNYFVGSDRRRWRTGIPTYARVRYQDVYPGIDVVYYGNGRRLEHDLVVAPGAEPAAIRLAFDGRRDVHVDGRGDLVLETDAGRLHLERPTIYQEVDGARRPVAGRYRVSGAERSVAERRVSIEVAAYDRTKPLVIDPVLSYSTLVGGGGIDAAHAIAVDAAGNAYVAGRTESADFPRAGALQPVIGGGFGGTSNDAFVLKLDPSGASLIYATFLGGSEADAINGIAVDGAGNAYVAGETASTDFPTTTGAFQSVKRAGKDAFVAKLAPSGAGLVYSTYLGSDDPDSAAAIAIDAAGSAYVTGETAGSLAILSPPVRNFPTTTGAFQREHGGIDCVFTIGTFRIPSDAFVTRLDPTGSVLLYSSYLGGGGDDSGTAIAVDGAGNAYVTGESRSANFPTTEGALRRTPPEPGFFSACRDSNAFVVKVNAAGTALTYSTLLGGSGADSGHGIAVDAAGQAHVTGSTASTDFPVTPGAVQGTARGGTDVFVARLAPGGDRLVYGTLVGGSGDDAGLAIALDAAGRAFVTGRTASADFPLTADAFQSTIRGVNPETGVPPPDAFVLAIAPDGSALQYSTLLGGSGTSPFGVGDAGRGIARDGAGRVYVAGSTNSTDFPVTSGAFQTFFAGGRGGFGLGGDAFVARFDLASTSPQPAPPPRLVFAVKPSSRSVRVGGLATTFVTVINAGTRTATGVRLVPSTPVPARFDFHTTDPRTNVTVGPQNAPVDIPAGGSQSFVIAFSPTAAFAQTEVSFMVVAAEVTAVSQVPGVDTFLLSASAAGDPDLVVLSETPTRDGIVTLGPGGGTNVFAAAIANVGTTGSITVAPATDVFAVSGPTRSRVLTEICETNPATGVCLGPLSNAITFLSVGGETRSFMVTVNATGAIPFDPAVNRVFLRFRDDARVIRGASSVAVRAP
jgi:hypothetical protein